MSSSLLSYQKPHVDSLVTTLTRTYVAIDSSDTGTGKTYCACAVAERLGCSIMVICPKSVISSWSRVISSFKLKLLGISNYESIRGSVWYVDGKKSACPHLSYSKTEKCFKWNLPPKTLLVFDEAHRCKNHKTQNAKILMALKDTSLASDSKILLLSATIADVPKYFRPFASLIGLCPDSRLFSIFLRNLQRRSPSQPLMYLLHRIIFPDFGSRLKISSLGDQFPRQMILADSYSMGNEVEKKIAEQYQLIHTVMTAAKEQEEQANCRLVQLLRARQKIEALKLPTIIELTRDHIESGSSVVVFTNFKDSLNLLAAELGAKCLIHGDQTLAERDAAIELFQQNKERLIICQIQSGGVGISLHDTTGKYPRVSIISPSWSAQDIAQALGRIYRANTKSAVIQKVVYCANTVEEQICQVIQEKLNNYSQINDGQMESKIKISAV